MMRFSPSDFWAIAPQVLVLVVAMVVLVWDAVRPQTSKRKLAAFSIAGLLATLVLQIWLWPKSGPQPALYGMLSADRFTAFFNITFLVGSIISILMSVEYLEQERVALGEYHALLLFTTVGMMVMAAAANLIVLFLGLEILSIALYVMAGYQRERLTSEEAALKYFLLGAFSSAFFLYGIALTYGASQTLNIVEIHRAVTLQGENENNYLMLAGISLMLVGFGFKVAVVPFHIWTPDVYEGAPTPVTAFMSVGAKAAGFAAFLRVLAQAFPSQNLGWEISIVAASVAALTMIVGNVVAIAQSNIKRMLAYSSIAHAGYILVGVVAALRDPSGEGVGAALFYTLVYTFTNLGAFGVILALRRRGEELLNMDDYRGLGYRYPLLGVMMAVFMLSLAGIPPTAGFFGKIYLFRSLLDLPEGSGMPWLLVIAVLTSVVSLKACAEARTTSFRAFARAALGVAREGRCFSRDPSTRRGRTRRCPRRRGPGSSRASGTFGSPTGGFRSSPAKACAGPRSSRSSSWRSTPPLRSLDPSRAAAAAFSAARPSGSGRLGALAGPENFRLERDLQEQSRASVRAGR